MNRQQRRAAARSGSPKDLFVAAVQHHHAGRLVDAEAASRRVLALQAHHADAMFNLAVALRQRGDSEGAIALYRALIEARPDYPEAAYNLGNALMSKGAAAEAAEAYRQALRIKPGHAHAAGNLALALTQHGVALLDAGAANDAADAFRQALALRPGAADAHYNLGNALKRLHRLDDAVAAFRQAILCQPALTEAHANLGTALLAQGAADDALAAYDAALRLMPDSAALHYNRGNALKDLHRLGEAAEAYAAALSRDATYAPAQANLAIVRMNQGRIGDALDAYRAALALQPDDESGHSNYLLALNYDERQSAADLFAAHRALGDRVPRHAATGHVRDRALTRRLRVGLVSPDLRRHSVASFVEPWLTHRDRDALEIVCFADVVRPDDTTARLRALSDGWIDTVAMSDDALTACIEGQTVDILIDLAGHTAHNRLGVFARKPAPVQVSWLGYPNTTGLAAMDARLVDAITDPEGADAGAVETLHRLPNGFLCYQGAADAPAIEPAPCLRNGYITFGSFNNPAKISDGTVAGWSRVLARVAGSRLLLKGRGFADAATARDLRARFEAHGIAAERIELIGWQPGNADHLALYGRMDIALDTSPYNGTTTSCEAMWMGVPVITLTGDRHAARVGASLLTHAGHPDWIARDIEGYIAIAERLADPARLQETRASLRAALSASDLCDGERFAATMQEALQALWRRWATAA